MSAITINRDLALELHRCWGCGNFWAIETRAGSGVGCPACLHDKRGEKQEEIDTLERRIRSLRGAITRARQSGK